MAKIVSVEQMVAIEKKADSSGLSYDQMMENAGRSVADHILDTWPDVSNFHVLVLVGPGNNGGDGLVAGFHLAQGGAEVAYYLLKPRSTTDGNLKRVLGTGASVVLMEEDDGFEALADLIATSQLIVDGLFGTGIQLPLRGGGKQLLRLVKDQLDHSHQKTFVAAIDCPSGVDCDTGDAAPECLSAGLTVTLAAVKTGLLLSPASTLIGKLVVGDIGLPEDSDVAAVNLEMMEDNLARSWLPVRPQHAHKGTFGKLLIIAGSINYPGAVVLAASGAYRSGVGLVTLAVPEPIYQPLVGAIPEATWLILPHRQGAISSNAVETVYELLQSSQALLLGPGFGLDRESQKFLHRLLTGRESDTRLGFVENTDSTPTGHLPPMVIDADALKLIAELPGWHKLIPGKSVLTPHPGEMSILCGLTIDQVQSDRIEVARNWAQKWGQVLVLKGANTVVASPKGPAMIIPVATSALAKAGTGDVLAGVISSLLAQGMKPYMAACLGAYLHGRAGMIAAEFYGTTRAVLASDVADALSEVFSELEAG